MSKKARFTFFRPHPRVQYTGRLVNHKTGEIFSPPDRTKQQFVEQCDINNIVKQFTKTGQFTHLAANAAKGSYSDLPDPIEFQESMNTVIQAEQAFASLPSKTRTRFANDPGEFLAFMSDPSNQDEIIKMGLAVDNRPPPPGPSGAAMPQTPQNPPPVGNGGDGGKPPSQEPKAP